MIRQLSVTIANHVLMASGKRAHRALRAALAQPQACQERVLRRILATNPTTAYGRHHGWAEPDVGDLVREYRQAFPVVDYDALAPWISRIRDGERNVLTTEPVLMFEKSSGSTAASKYIPYTRRLRNEFQSATSTWLYDLLAQRPRLRQLGSYWSVSPVAQAPEVTAGGLRVGFEDDTEYFDPLERWVLGQLMLVPGTIKRTPDVASCRYVTLRFLLERDDLGMISVWNPTFLTLLMQEIEVQGDRLVRDLQQGTLTPPTPLDPALQASLERGLTRRPRMADRLKALLTGPSPLLGTELWPRLQLISCWTSGISGRFLPDMQERFPGVEIQGKGLLATEGVVSIPLLGHPGSVLALDSHFYEFVPEGAEPSAAKLAHELEVGKRYTVLMTTGGGLYRYALHDMIEVVGRLEATPLIDFVGKSARISDLVGEKLNELHVGQVFDLVFRPLPSAPRFAMLAPELDEPDAPDEPPCYALYLEHPDVSDDELDALAALVDSALRANHHYAYARDLGQLGPVRGRRVPNDGAARYLEGCVALGQKAGDVKPTMLHPAPGWRARLTSPRSEVS